MHCLEGIAIAATHTEDRASARAAGCLIYSGLKQHGAARIDTIDLAIYSIYLLSPSYALGTSKIHTGLPMPICRARRLPVPIVPRSYTASLSTETLYPHTSAPRERSLLAKPRESRLVLLTAWNDRDSDRLKPPITERIAVETALLKCLKPANLTREEGSWTESVSACSRCDTSECQSSSSSTCGGGRYAAAADGSAAGASPSALVTLLA